LSISIARQTQGLKIPVGDVIYALVANRLCSPEPLVHVAGWAECSGVEFLPGTPAEALNDDRPARALDAIYYLAAALASATASGWTSICQEDIIALLFLQRTL